MIEIENLLFNPKNICDTQGLRCPEPIMEIRKTIRLMKTNEILLIIADDPSTIRDVPSFCHFMQHKLLAKEIINVPYKYLIRKK